MKTIAVHSHKGGVGKTTVALLLVKYAALSGRKVCVVDFDFIGSGMADLFAIVKRPDRYLEHYFISAEPNEFNLQSLLGKYTDEDMGTDAFSVMLNLGEDAHEKAHTELKDTMTGLMANEPHYREIETKTKILLGKLRDLGTDLVVVDCHPGLVFASETMRLIADLNVYVTTPNRSDCFSFLKTVNLRKELDNAKAFLIVNRAEPFLTDPGSFRRLIEDDGLVGTEAKNIFPHRKFIGRREEHFAAVPESKLFLQQFYLGQSGVLPRIEAGKPEFSFCQKILSLV